MNWIHGLFPKGVLNRNSRRRRGALVPSEGGNPRLLISAGEVSGDQAGALLADNIKRRRDIELVGVGGSRMKAAGVRVLHDTNLLGTVGLTEALKTFPGVTRTFLKIRRLVSLAPPDAAVLIGHDLFHMIVGRLLRAKKIPTIAYFPPQVWIWKSMAGQIAGCYDLILTSFPEEETIYRKAGARTLYVGHYLAERIAPADRSAREKARAALGMGNEGPVIGLFPGSRFQEIAGLCPGILDSASLIRKRVPGARFVLAVADRSYERRIFEFISEKGMSDTVLPWHDSLTAMAASDLLLLCSGTVTLQAAFMNIPMIVLYRVSAPTWMAGALLNRLGWLQYTTMALPNLIAGKKVVEELRQEDARAENVAEMAVELLSDRRKYLEMQTELRAVSRIMKTDGAIEKAGRAVLMALPPR